MLSNLFSTRLRRRCLAAAALSLAACAHAAEATTDPMPGSSSMSMVSASTPAALELFSWCPHSGSYSRAPEHKTSASAKVAVDLTCESASAAEAAWQASIHSQAFTTAVEEVKTEQSARMEQQRGQFVRYITNTFKVSAELSQRIVTTAYMEAAKWGISPFLVLAIIEKESSFRPHATNQGAVGLMQVMASVHQRRFAAQAKAPVDLSHPETNIRIGTTILGEYRDLSRGSVPHALKRYSGGSSQYAEQVLGIYQRMKEQLLGPGEQPRR